MQLLFCLFINNQVISSFGTARAIPEGNRIIEVFIEESSEIL